MKKISLLLSVALLGFAANAQPVTPVALTGSSYTQNFDDIGSAGLPAEWGTFSGSSSSSIGSISLFSSSQALPSCLATDSTSCDYEVRAGGFKNYPSGDVCSEGDDNCATPAPANGYTNRALGVRQVSPTNSTHPNLDSGAAFVLAVANTTGRTNFNLSFKLQSLDSSSPRITTWLVDYGTAASSSATPTLFTPAASTGTVTGTWRTGGKTFSNNTCTVNFGRFLDDISTPVYIRIVTLQFSSDSISDGNRGTTAIDDYTLTWESTTAVSVLPAQPSTALTVIGQPVSDKVILAYTVDVPGAYALNIYDLTGRIIHTETIDAQTGGQSITLNGLNLTPGMYIAKMNNSNSSSVAKISVQ